MKVKGLTADDIVRGGQEFARAGMSIEDVKAAQMKIAMDRWVNEGIKLTKEQEKRFGELYSQTLEFKFSVLRLVTKQIGLLAMGELRAWFYQFRSSLFDKNPKCPVCHSKTHQSENYKGYYVCRNNMCSIVFNGTEILE